MISRYSRRPVSHKLEIRGLSRSSLDHHPLPEEDIQTPPRFLHDLQGSGSAHNSSQTSGASGRSDCPTIIPVDSNQSWSGIHSCTGTGVSTERSSVFSWGYDEFDKAASRQVQQMFEEIDRELYEGRGSGSGILPGLMEECQQWTSRFPHLRILGKQLLHPTDEGFQWFATPGGVTPADRPSTGRDGRVKPKEKDEDEAELNVQGRRAPLIRSCSVDLDDPPHDCSSLRSPETPQEIEVEGLMEEFLAFDCRDVDEGQEGCSEWVQRHHCLPPVSPHEGRRQAVLDSLFDDVWQEAVGWMKDLLQSYWEYCSYDETISGSVSLAQPDSQDALLLMSALSTTLPKLGQSRMTPFTAGPQYQNTEARGSKQKSRWKSKKQKRPSTTGRAPIGAAAAQHNFNDLMVIQSIPLQHRNLGQTDRNQDQEELPAHRLGSSAAPSNKLRPRRALEQSSSSLSRTAQSARRRNPPPRNLLPLVPSFSQSSSGGVSLDEVIRGKRLPTASDPLTSPLLALSRNTLLPPIGTADLESSHAGQHPKLSQRQKGPSSRAHSAINDEAGGLIPRDRHQFLDIFSRPNTTHTYRSDTPYQRSFTILDNIGLGRAGRGSVGADSLGIGVTGISLGISSSSFLDSFPHHPLGHSPIKDDGDAEPQAVVPAPLVPASVAHRSHSRGGISSRASRPGL
ncbi:protein FAM149B1 isoform X1 [Oryzias melastigma]|uniref:Family with sequence similarity 149 member B1 n=1 Tax=Oryzias melastigma TaxID=30732 RepID=A0A3B3DDL7_ORYME|nr:protein FAM149B1 isoform X1 [Oryzias melastigma]